MYSEVYKMQCHVQADLEGAKSAFKKYFVVAARYKSLSKAY